MQQLDNLSPVSYATAAILILLSIIYYFIKNKDVLPGPRGLPFFGLYPYLRPNRSHLQLEEFGKTYGDLYSFRYVGKLIINLGSAKAVREVHVNKSDCFSSRYTGFSLLNAAVPNGAVTSNGEEWKALRKFFIQCFRERGLTKMQENTAGPVYDTIARTIEDLKSRNGVPFNVIELLTKLCTGTMQKVVFGEDGVSDEDMGKFIATFAKTADALTGHNLLLMGPVGRFILNMIPQCTQTVGHFKVLASLMLETAKKIESKMDENHPTCVVEDFYQELRARKRRNDPSWKYLSDTALVSSLIQFVGDGIITVAYFVGCLVYGLIEHPEEQEKIYQELIEVVGVDRQVAAEDRSKLPYTNAFVNEVMRTSDFFPLFPSLECTKETTIRGYKIPKGSVTLLNFWHAHHDPGTYKNPNKFDPSRFVPTSGKTRPELPIQFGLGKRSCTGESFVMLQGFLFLTSIIKNFTISEPNKASKSGQTFMSGFMELSLVPRKEK